MKREKKRLTFYLSTAEFREFFLLRASCSFSSINELEATIIQECLRKSFFQAASHAKKRQLIQWTSFILFKMSFIVNDVANEAVV